MEEGTFSLQVFIDSEWIDPRVTVRVPNGYGQNVVPITGDLQLWNPKVRIYNAKAEQDVKQSYFRGSPDHRFESGRQSMVTMSCDMEYLDLFPFDHYSCEFQVVNLDGNYKVLDLCITSCCYY